MSDPLEATANNNTTSKTVQDPKSNKSQSQPKSKRPADSRPTQISKKLSYLLRHGALKENLPLDTEGYALASDLLSNRQLRSLKVSFPELRQIVEDNDKKRYTLVTLSPSDDTTSTSPSSNDPSQFKIRANQGHSLALSPEALRLEPITLSNAPATVVHGTTHKAWPLILASGGLKPMGRNHVHFASGLPAGFAPGEGGRPPVISGMRNSSTVLVFLNVEKALAMGLRLWRSENGVILTEGDGEGIVPVSCFRRVESRRGEGVLVEEGRVVGELPAKGKGERGGVE